MIWGRIFGCSCRWSKRPIAYRGPPLSSPSITIIFHAVAKRCDVFICKSPLSGHPLLWASEIRTPGETSYSQTAQRKNGTIRSRDWPRGDATLHSLRSEADTNIRPIGYARAQAPFADRRCLEDSARWRSCSKPSR